MPEIAKKDDRFDRGKPFLTLKAGKAAGFFEKQDKQKRARSDQGDAGLRMGRKPMADPFGMMPLSLDHLGSQSKEYLQS